MQKYRAKVWNERLKLFAAYLNAVAIAVLVFAIVRPYFDASAPSVVGGLSMSILMHLAAQATLSTMRDEEA